ncbi:hypothetical protein Kisp02_70460 [Kineosporia sp. NBRC 101731]|nr:hypothetical protein Kisp02_70460 [Kineosporia sp. NBRC 101731]
MLQPVVRAFIDAGLIVDGRRLMADEFPAIGSEIQAIVIEDYPGRDELRLDARPSVVTGVPAPKIDATVAGVGRPVHHLLGLPRTRGLIEYVETLQVLIGRSAVVHEVQADVPEHGPVFAVIFTRAPEAGWTTAFSYGLSQISGEQGRSREIALVVRSEDPDWGFVPARVVSVLRGRLPFAEGRTLEYREPWARDSRMNGLLFAPAAGHYPGLADVAGRPIEMLGAYPLHGSELRLIAEYGADRFLKLVSSPLDPNRNVVREVK